MLVCDEQQRSIAIGVTIINKNWELGIGTTGNWELGIANWESVIDDSSLFLLPSCF
ncbi:hypothetical protein [Microcoleus sp. F4-D5]|uniref:hypothetical protein n=1 Tax=Microcoleus sp. F4-D5 TaxID=2818760 RepID=UPI002FD0C012